MRIKKNFRVKKIYYFGLIIFSYVDCFMKLLIVIIIFFLLILFFYILNFSFLYQENRIYFRDEHGKDYGIK